MLGNRGPWRVNPFQSILSQNPEYPSDIRETIDCPGTVQAARAGIRRPLPGAVDVVETGTWVMLAKRLALFGNGSTHHESWYKPKGT